MGDRQYDQHNRGYRGGHHGGGRGGGYGGGYDQQGYQHHRGGGRGGRWQGGEGRGGGRGYGRGGGPHHGGMDGGRGGGGAGGAGGGGYQRSYIGGGKRGREDGPEGQPPKLSPQHLLVAKLLGVCDRNTNSGRDNWTDERFFDDLLKSCRRDLEHGGDNVAGLLVEAAVEVSFKTQHYALVLGILNTERPDFSRRVTAAVVSDLRACLAAPDPRPFRAKQLLRYLAALHAVNVVSAEWLLAALTALVQAATAGLAAAVEAAGEPGDGGLVDEALVEAGGDDGEEDPDRRERRRRRNAAGAAVQPWSDFLVYAVLAALPWCGRDLAAADATSGGGGEGGEGGGGGEADGGRTLAGLLALVDSYMAARPVAADEALRPMMGARSDEDLAAKSDSGGASFLGDLWSAITECRYNAWEVAVLPGPHVPYVEKLAAAQPLEGLEPLEVPHWPPGVDSSLPTPLLAARIRALYPARGGIRLLTREYLEGDLPAVERVVVEEYVLDTLAALSSDRTACVLTLSSALPHHLAAVFGPQRATVRNFVAEALFSQMLRLPSPALSHAAYCTLLVDLCKVPHFQFARALSSCVRELFGCMPYLDPELRFRLASWLSYHLSSFSYQWPWDRWQWVSERPPHDSQRGFCVLLLHRLLRLADYPVVKQSLPPYFQALLGPPATQRCPPLPGNMLPHHQAGAHLAQLPQPFTGQQPPPPPGGGGGGGPRGRGGGRAHGSDRRAAGAGDADPDLLEDDQQQPQPMQVDENGAGGAGEGGGAGGEEADGQGKGPAAGPAAAPPAWAGDPVAETAARLVAWCRQEGAAVAAATKARSLRPEQVAALWSNKVGEWLAEHGAQLAEEKGPLAAPKVLITLILALGVKSPSHLHVAVERYAEAVRAAVAAADADAEALGALPPGSWRAAAAAMGASAGQSAMMEVVRHYHSGEPQRLLLVTDRLMALHVMDGPAAVAALFADVPLAELAAAAGEREGREAAAGGDGEEAEGGGRQTVCVLSYFQDPVLSCGGWEVLLHVLDRLVAMPTELPAEVEAWEKKVAQLQGIHAGVLQSVAAGAPGLVQRERDVAAQVDQASRCLEVVRSHLERSSAQAQDALLLTYLGFVRLLNRAAADTAAAAMDDEATSRCAATTSLLGAWLRAVLRRYAEPSAALLGSGRLREEATAHEQALGGPMGEEFVAAVQTQLGVRL